MHKKRQPCLWYIHNLIAREEKKTICTLCAAAEQRTRLPRCMFTNGSSRLHVKYTQVLLSIKSATGASTISIPCAHSTSEFFYNMLTF